MTTAAGVRRTVYGKRRSQNLVHALPRLVVVGQTNSATDESSRALLATGWLSLGWLNSCLPACLPFAVCCRALSSGAHARFLPSLEV
ncbi:hypothetical protein AWZ03_000127 [Drosophila navojoa]|uniref:Uncharacterized protein n=1 Tax=Drosophila navojoa TaxID=7232 RepID=A0A484C0Q0_DRONA|nr:hypothetical protein AWZ03_000127 [Drosophila navojoa]